MDFDRDGVVEIPVLQRGCVQRAAGDVQQRLQSFREEYIDPAVRTRISRADDIPRRCVGQLCREVPHGRK